MERRRFAIFLSFISGWWYITFNSIYRLALDKDPDYVRALVLMGRVLLLKHVNDEAHEYFERAISKVWIIPAKMLFLICFAGLSMSSICSSSVNYDVLLHCSFRLFLSDNSRLISLSFCCQPLIIFWYFFSLAFSCGRSWSSQRAGIACERQGKHIVLWENFCLTGFWIYVKRRLEYASDRGNL